MKNFFIINDTTANKISYYHLAAFLVLLPVDYFYSELVLFSFGIHTLIHLKKTDLRKLLSKPVLVMTAVYLVGILGMLYSPDMKEAVNVSTRQLAIFLFPVLLTLNGLDLSKYRSGLLQIFAITCVITILYLYADALHTIFYFKLPLRVLFSTPFMNHNFSMPLELHATYMSMYAGLSVIIFLYLIQQEKAAAKKIFYVLCCLVLMAGLLQLSSRAVFIAVLIILNIVFPLFIDVLKKRILFICLMSLTSAAVLLMIFSIDAFKTRYISALKDDLGKQSLISENSEPRTTRWKIALDYAKRSPIIGYGSGSEKKLLKEKYFEQKLFISYINEFNCHSQYLSFLLKTGIIGLGIYCYLLFFGLIAAVRNRDMVCMGFMVMIGVVSVSENILDVNKGIFFYAFFLSLFLLSYKKKTAEPAEKGNQSAENPVL